MEIRPSLIIYNVIFKETSIQEELGMDPYASRESWSVQP